MTVLVDQLGACVIAARGALPTIMRTGALEEVCHGCSVFDAS